MKKNNIKHLILLLAIHFAGFQILVAAMAIYHSMDVDGFLAWFVPVLISYILRYALAFFTIFFIHKKWLKQKCNRFILPISFCLLTPFILITFPIGYNLIYGHITCPMGWSDVIFPDVVFFSLPFAVIAFILATKKPKHGSA